MRLPLWILNISLFFIALIALGFVLFSRQKPPAREDIEPVFYPQPIKTDISKINLSKIYENDLFDTYRKELPIPAEKNLGMPLPEPPLPRTLHMPPAPAPQFLEPLKITLKGIVAVSTDDAQNIAIVADIKTSKEVNYRVGDTFEDAQLLRIFKNKVVFIRANGQQEVLYLRQQDAKKDPAFAVLRDWDDVIKNLGDNSFVLSPTEFVKRIATLSDVIEMLDLTTVYQKGQSIGVRVGTLPVNSFAPLFGLIPGDIIVSVNAISVANSGNRLAAYKNVISMKLEDTLTVVVHRRDQEMVLKIKLSELEKNSAEKEIEQAALHEMNLYSDAQQERLRAFEQKHKLAPTVQEIRMHEKRAMVEKGRVVPNSMLQPDGQKKTDKVIEHEN